MKKIFNLLALALCVFTLQSCLHDDDEVFDTPAAVRIQQSVEDVKAKLLSSPNGWLMQYWTGEDYSGSGYNVLVRFDKAYAYVSADYADADMITHSSWDVKKDQGPVLTFDTYNAILHAMSDPSSAAIDGEEGDFEFVVERMTADSIYVHGKKWKNSMVLVRLADDVNWKNYIEAAQSTVDALGRTYRSAQGTDILVNRASRRIFVGEDAIGVPFCPNATSICFSDSINIDGVSITSLDVDRYGDLSNAALGAIEQVVPPLAEQFLAGDWFITYENVGPFGKAYFDDADATLLATEGEKLVYACLCKGNFIRSTYTAAWGFTFYTDAGYAGQLTMDAEVLADDKVSMIFAFVGQGDGVYYHNNCKFYRYLQVIGYNAPKTFTLTADNPKSPTEITLTDDENPNNWVKVISKEATYK